MAKKQLVWNDHFTAQRKMDIKKGDTVVIIAGRDTGKSGRVLEVRPRENRLVVENLNVVIKHEKVRNARPGEHREGRHEMPAPLDRSNVMLIDPTSKKPTKIGHRLVEGKWLRYAKVSGELVDE